MVLLILQMIPELLNMNYSNLYLITSETTFDMLNDSLGLIVTLSIPSMIAKYFVLELRAYHNDVINNENYLRVSMNAFKYQSMHFVYQGLTLFVLSFYVLVVNNKAIILLDSIMSTPA